jgi:putative tricarboxylic transport membrane protein
MLDSVLLHSKIVFSTALACVIALANVALAQAQSAWKPSKTVEIVVGFAAGGGNDKSSRVMQKIWQDARLFETIVTNKVGGGGALAYTYVSQKAGDGHVLAVAQGGLLTNHITGRSPLSYNDLTPLAFVGNEPVALAVKSDAPYKNLREFAERLKKDPASLSISVGSTLGAVNHFTVALLAKAAGIDPKKLKIVVFGGGAESVTNLLGGHIDAMSQAVNNAIPHHQSGTIRILAISTARRSTRLPDVPTFREQGYDVLVDGWTIFVGPKGMSPAQIAFWENTFAKSVQTDEWKKYLDSNAWESGYKNAQDTLAYLKNQDAQAKALSIELGLAR